MASASLNESWPRSCNMPKFLAVQMTQSCRSVLGALLWITATGLEVVADVSLLQSRVTVAEVKDLKLANTVIDKADVGLHYRFFETDFQRIVCVLCPRGYPGDDR